MRTFLAVTPPKETALNIHRAYTSMRDAWEGVNWIPPYQYHITLAFLGDHSTDEVDAAASSFTPIIESFRTFGVSFSGLGHLGAIHSPRALVLKVGRGKVELATMLEGLRPILENLSMWENRPYHPHLTLGRPKRSGATGPAEGELLPPGMKSANVRSFRAGEVILYQSVLQNKGPDYSAYRSWSLKES